MSEPKATPGAAPVAEKSKQKKRSRKPKGCAHPTTKQVNGKTHCGSCGVQLYL